MTFLFESNILQENIKNNIANETIYARYLLIPHKMKGNKL